MRIQRYITICQRPYFRSIQAVELAEIGLDGVYAIANHLAVMIPFTVGTFILISRA